MEEKERKHQRRVRYSGTHPKSYQEKYKEHQPERYADTIAKVISKGSTPAGMHLSIMVQEILDFLQIQPGQTGLDATLGYGGHTLAMLKRLEGQGHLYALDVDSLEIEKTRKRLAGQGYGEDIVTIIQENFCKVGQIAREYGPFDFMMADLGVSSMQLDNPERGFSYKFEGPLDLRLDPLRGESAAQRLRSVSEEELRGMLEENADEPYAAEIAAAVRRRFRKGGKIETTTELRELICEALSFLPEREQKDTRKKACQRTFQALRIDVNSEFEVLEQFLEKLPEALAPGGRVAILTFHSGEDRLVKKSFKQHYRQGIYREIAEEVIRPSAEECSRNGRARPAKMRWAVKV